MLNGMHAFFMCFACFIFYGPEFVYMEVPTVGKELPLQFASLTSLLCLIMQVS